MHRYEKDGVTFYRFAGLDDRSEVSHVIFTRLGGVSKPPFAELNLGHTVGDDLASVGENHSRVYRTLEITDRNVVTAWLVHGRAVHVVDHRHAGQAIKQTDGLITQTAGLVLFQRFADCLPILFFDPVRSAVGITHAGWRGTVAGVSPTTVRAMQTAFGSRPEDLWVGIGPGIGPCCYEVGGEVTRAVGTAFVNSQVLLPRVNGAVHFDLPGANVRQLQSLGVKHIEAASICTACRVDEFFSHRAERGNTGRFGVAIGLASQPGE
ncbi:MAG: peptidoglycan editing factor PgeF [Anaerolineae bacterium]